MNRRRSNFIKPKVKLKTSASKGFDRSESHSGDRKTAKNFSEKPFAGKNSKPASRFSDKSTFEKKERPSRSFSDKALFSKSLRPLNEGKEETFKKTFNTRQRTKPEFKTGKSIAEKPRLYADNSTRLNKIIAASGICSRREADDMIKSGLISVNGKVVTELGTKVKPEDDVRYNGERLRKEKLVYILLNKPKDYVTTSKDPFAKRTVLDLIKGACNERVYPVGRLDRNTTGVLLLTNDGELTRKLTHPSQNRKKIYQVSLDKNLKQTDYWAIKNGVELEDGLFIKPDAVEFNIEGDKKEVGIEIHSGQNRIVRRIFEKFGYEVVRLDRVYFCGLTKKGLQRGFWRFLTEQEINMLRMGRFE